MGDILLHQNTGDEIDGDVEDDSPRDVNEQTQTDKEYDI
jgi:hypothetical protein